MEDERNLIDLNEAVQHLRGQLSRARRELAKRAEDEAGELVRFQVQDIELELQVALSRSDENQQGGKLGIKCWVLSADASLGAKQSTQTVATHVVRLKLKPSVQTSAGVEELEIGDGTGPAALPMDSVD